MLKRPMITLSGLKALTLAGFVTLLLIATTFYFFDTTIMCISFPLATIFIGGAVGYGLKGIDGKWLKHTTIVVFLVMFILLVIIGPGKDVRLFITSITIPLGYWLGEQLSFK